MGRAGDANLRIYSLIMVFGNFRKEPIGAEMKKPLQDKDVNQLPPRSRVIFYQSGIHSIAGLKINSRAWWPVGASFLEFLVAHPKMK